MTIPPAITVYLGGWLADRTSLRLVYGLAGAWVLLAAVGSRFLPGYRAIPVRSEEGTVEEGIAAVDTAPDAAVDG